MASMLRNIFVNLRLGTGTFTQDTGKAIAQINKMGKKLKGVGRDLSRNLSAPLAGIGLGAAKASIDFESAFAGVRKTVNASEKEFKGFSDEIKRLSTVIPASTTEIAGVAEAAGQLGVKNKDLISFTETMLKLGTATNMSAETAAVSLAQFTNITGLAPDKIENLGATIVALGNNFATTEAEIVEMSLRLAAAGTDIGLTEANILGFSAALTSVGIAAESGGTAFSRVFKDIAKAVDSGGKKLDEFAKVAGITAEQFASDFKEKPAEAITQFIEGFVRIKKEGGSALQALDDVKLGAIRTSDALLRTANAGNLVRGAIEGSNTAWSDNVALNIEAAERYKTLASRLTIAWGQVRLLAIEIGDTLRPTIEKTIDFIALLTGALRGFSDKTKDVIVNIGLVVAALGPVLLALGALVTILTGPMVLAIGGTLVAVSAATAVWVLWGDGIIQWGKDSIHWIGLVLSELIPFEVSVKSVGESFSALWENSKRKFALIISAINLITEHWDKLTTAMATALGIIVPGFNAIARSVGNANIKFEAHKKIQEATKKAAEENAKAIQDQKEAIAEYIKEAGGIGAVKKKFSDAKDETTSWAKSILGLKKAATETTVVMKNTGKQSSEYTKGVKEAERAVKDLQDQLRDLKREGLLEDLNKSFQNAINSGDFDGARELAEKLREATERGVLEGLGDAVSKSGAQASELAGSIASETGKKIKDSLIENVQQAQTENAKDLVEKQKKAHEESVGAWESLFQNAITGTTFNLEDALKQVAVGFAAEMANSIFGSIGEGIEGPQDLGSAIGKGLGKLFGDGESGGIPGLQGGDPLVGGQIGGGGGGGGGGFAASAGMIAIVAAINGATKGINAWNDNNPFQTGQDRADRAQIAWHEGVFDTIGLGELGKMKGELLADLPEWMSFALDPIGGSLQLAQKAFGFGGTNNEETAGRKGMQELLSDMLKEATGGNGLNIKGTDGEAKLLDVFNFRDTSDQFNTEEGFAFFDSLDSEARGTFDALATAFADIFDLPEDTVLGQFSVLFAENLMGDIDNVRLFVQKLGIDFETLKGAMLESALDGEQSWLEFNTAVRDLGDAFEPGLKAVGDVKGAFENLVISGGRGFEAVKGIKDLAIEALQAGGSTLDDLGSKLSDAGVSAEDVDKILSAMTGRGITGLQELADASDELAGAIVGDLDAKNFGFADLSQDIMSVKDAFKELEDFKFNAKKIQVEIDVTGDKIPAGLGVQAAKLGGVFQNIDAFAKGGIVNSLTAFQHSGGFGIMGEAGAEAILPLGKTRSGELGVKSDGGGGTVVNVNINGEVIEGSFIARVQSEIEQALDTSNQSLGRSI